MTAARNRRIKFAVYSLELLLLFILQGMAILPIFGERPLLILAALITLSLLESEIPALFFGLFGGLLMDVSAGGPLGLNAMVCATLCCLISVVVRRKIHVTMLSAMGIGAGALGVVIGLDWLFRYVLGGYGATLFVLVNNYVPRFLYTLLMIPLVYLMNLGLYSGFRIEDSED